MSRPLGRVLAVRLDSDGDVLLTGPAVRALAATAESVDLLCSPAGTAAGRLLPGVREVLTFAAPWSGYAPPPVDAPAVSALVEDLAARRYDSCVVFTSFHQSALPMALLARLAGIGLVAATSEDYPGSQVDVRHPPPAGRGRSRCGAASPPPAAPARPGWPALRAARGPPDRGCRLRRVPRRPGTG